MTAQAFRTPGGLLVPAITAEQMRQVDRVAVEQVGPNLYQMMENAGRNLATSCVETLGDGWEARPVLVLAGTGGNGGGGLCAARHLVNHGGDVTVAVSEPARLTGVPAEQLALYRAAGARIVSVADVEAVDAELVVDAMLGYSLRGAPRGAARRGAASGASP